MSTMLTGYRKKLEVLINELGVLIEDPNDERYTRLRKAEAINDAILEFALDSQMIFDEINVQLKENVREYDIKTRINEDGTKRDYGVPIRLGFNGEENPAMWPTDLQVLDSLLINDEQQRFGEITDFKPQRRWHVDVVSPGKVSLFPAPNQDGEDLPSEENNMQVTYIAFPTYMDSEDDYPDSVIQAYLHQAFKYGGAYRLLDEGDEDDIRLADAAEAEFNNWVQKAVAEYYRGQTMYDDARPG